MEAAYAQPAADRDDEHDELEDDDEEEAPSAVWYAVPLWRLWLFSLLGGLPYQGYWAYRSWCAFRVSEGYSRHALWRARYRANGFRVSPFWRALLGVYTYCFMLVVRREARLARVSGFGPPWVWFAAQLSALTFLPLEWGLLALSLAFVPVQSVVNRIHDRVEGTRTRARLSAAELCWLALGLLWTRWVGQALLVSS